VALCLFFGVPEDLGDDLVGGLDREHRLVAERAYERLEVHDHSRR